MEKRMKILFSVVIFLGVISGGFLIYMKIKTPASVLPTQKNVSLATTSQQGGNTDQLKAVQANSIVQQDPVTQVAANSPASPAVDNLTLIDDQAKIDWQACNKKTIAAGKVLYWQVTISEAIPQGGTYAKGTMLGLPAFPVRITIKAGAQDAAKIKSKLVVGKGVVRGTCIGTAQDGSVSFEAY